MVRQELANLTEALEAGQSERLRSYLQMMGRFHRYSAGNVLLIGSQRPQATRVAGFWSWKRLGRKVKKGEKAIRILAPIVVRDKDEKDDTERERVAAFRSACVFDISQTEGRPLVKLAEASGEPGVYLESLQRFVKEQGIELEYSTRLGATLGLSEKGRIIIKSGLTGAEEFSVLVHELAHELLHQRDEPRPESREICETEAEAVAYVVSQAIGLAVGEAACDYIQLYRGNSQTLLGSLERIRRTAREIIQAIMPEEEPVRNWGSISEPQNVEAAA